MNGASGAFGADLYERLAIVSIRMPPLRERIADLPALVTHFVNIFSRRMGTSIETVPPETMEAFVSYAWPGNIRELQNLVERAVILSNDGVLPNPLPVPSPARVRSGNVREPAFGIADADLAAPKSPAATAPSDAAKRHEIEEALRTSRGRVSGADGAARVLGVAPSTLESRIQRLGIDKHTFRRRTQDRPYFALGHPALS